MDIVQGVHEEVGIDLVFQILKLLLEVLMLQLCHLLSVASMTEIELYAQVHA